MQKEVRTYIGISPFHPTPSLGPFRTMLYTYAFARKYGGLVYLKCDDTNPNSRNTENLFSQIDFLRRAGCIFETRETNYFHNSVIFQSANENIYQKYLETVVDARLTSTKQDLISLDIQKLAVFLNIKSIIVRDVLKGDIEFNIKKSGYLFIPLYSLSEKRFLFHLPAVVDEVLLKANILIRGEDKISIAPIHDLLRAFFGIGAVEYLHLPLLTEVKAGKRLRGKDYYLDYLITKYLFEVLVAYTLKSGYISRKLFYRNIDDFIKEFDYRNIKKQSGGFSLSELNSIATKFHKEI